MDYWRIQTKLLGVIVFVTLVQLALVKSNTAPLNQPISINSPDDGTPINDTPLEDSTLSKSSTPGTPTFTLRPLNTGGSTIDMSRQITDEAIEKTLNDKRYLQRLLKCAVGEGPCDPVGRRIKSLAPLVLRGNCPMCTPSEQKQIRKVLAYVQINFPKEWNKILQTYAG